MARRLASLISLIALISLSFAIAEVQLHIYVRNKPYKGDVMRYGSKLYLELRPLIDLMGLKYVVQDGVFYIATSGEPTAQNAPRYMIYIDNQPFSASFKRGDKVFVEMESFCQATGFKAVYNKDTGIVDILSRNRRVLSKLEAKALLKTYAQREKAKKKVEENKEEAKSSSNEEQQTEAQESKEKISITAGEKEKAKKKLEIPQDAIIVTNVTKYIDRRPIPNAEVRVSADVKNKWKKTVENVVVTLMVVDGYGKPVKTQVYRFGNMKPGEVKKINFLWYNSTNIPVDIRFEISFKGKKAPTQSSGQSGKYKASSK